MTISKLHLKQFKCFKDIELDFSKITLLTGANSSGKSSLMYALLSALQSRKFPFYLSPNGNYVNMGDFEEISFSHAKNTDIEIDVVIDDFQKDTWNFVTRWAFDSSSKMPSLSYLHIHGGHADLNIRNNGAYSLNFEHDIKSEEYLKSDAFKLNNVILNVLESAFEEFEYDIVDDLAEQNSIDFNTLRENFFRLKNVKDLNFTRLEELDQALIKSKNLGIITFLTQISRLFQSMNTHLNYIGSFRLEPERTYYRKSKPDTKIERDGKGYIDQILDWQDEKSQKFRELNALLKELHLLQKITITQFHGGRFELKAKVMNTGNKGIWASLADVGFGVSQFLPIIVADLQLPKNSTLLLAQPEIHLHPSIQATLGDYFIKQVNKNNKNYIIETHSEYLLNRIRLALVKREIEPGDVSVYYLEHSGDGSVAHRIEFTQDGQIKNAPKGFFETYMMDVMEIALHA